MRRLWFLLVLFALVGLMTSCAMFNSEPEPNRDPFADFSCTPTTGDSPLEVTFNATDSSDSDGYIKSYQWDFGDARSGAGIETTHTYTTTESKTFIAKLTVTDNRDATDTYSRSIYVRPPVPTPMPPAPPCNCSGPDLDCADFSSHSSAQACYDYCKQRGYGDVFQLDSDSDGIACESL